MPIVLSGEVKNINFISGEIYFFLASRGGINGITLYTIVSMTHFFHYMTPYTIAHYVILMMTLLNQCVCQSKLEPQELGRESESFSKSIILVPKFS